MTAQECGKLVCSQLFDPLLGLWTTSRVVGGPSKNNREKVQTLISLGHGHALATLFASEGRKLRYNGNEWVSLPPEKDWTYIRTQFATTTLLDPPACRQPVRPPGFEQYPCGAVLIAGGQNLPQFDPYNNNAGEVDFTADLYTYDTTKPEDPGKVLPLVRMPADHPGHRKGFTIPLDDGRVLVAGGEGFPHTQAVFFDPMGGEPYPDGHREGAWSWADSLPHPVRNPEYAQSIWTARLPGARERFLVGGGSGAPLVFEPAGGPFDPATGKPIGSWAQVSNCKEGADCIGGVLRPDGTILVVARTPLFAQQPPASFVLDPAGDDPTSWKWTAVAPPDATPAATINSALLLDGAGKPEQCGANCGLVLASGFSGLPDAGIGTAQLFGTLLEVTGVSPPEGPACGGRPVTISGRGLDRVTSVNFGTARVEAITRNPDGSITVASPRHPSGAVPVTVSTSGGAATTKASANAIFTYTPVEPPRVTGLSTREGRADRRTPVTINGSFPAECVRQVTFGGGEATFAPPGPTAIKATSPTGTPGASVPVEVLFDPGPPTAADRPMGGVATPPGTNLFSYRALPAITAVPGVSALGGTVSISGSNLERDGGDEPHQVSFDGQAGTVARASATGIEATAPPLAPGKSPSRDALLTVETAKRGRSEPASFAYHPGVRGIFPSSGFTTGGESRTITGVGLRTADKVLIGGEEARILDRPADQDALVVRTPARAAPESVRVEVIVAGLVSLEPIFFTYGDPPPSPEDPGNRDTGITPGQREPVVQVAPPGGTGSPAPGASPSPSPSASPGGSGAASASASASASGGSSGSPSQAASATHAQASAGAAGLAPAPAPGPAAAPAQATPGSGGAPGSGQAGLGGEDERGEVRHAPRHNMTAANMGLGLGAAGAAMCFSGLALARRRRSARSRPRPCGAY